MLDIKITVTGGAYRGASFEGPLAQAPTTVLVPEGIVSRRTSDEAERVRASIERHLGANDRVVLTAPRAGWQITAERAASAQV